MRIKFLLYIFPLSLLFMAPAQGQSQELQKGVLKKYTPPSLFAEPKLPPPLPVHPKSDLKLPPISRQIELPAEKTRPTSFAAESNMKIGKVKDVKAITEDQKLETSSIPPPEEKPQIISPLPTHKPKYAPPKIAKKTPKKKYTGIVKGPKTMPANKKQDVEIEETYKAVNLSLKQTPITIESIQIIKDQPLPVVEALLENLKLPVLIDEPDGSRKLLLYYLNAQTDILPNHGVILKKVLISELEIEGNARVLIQSYASPQAGILSSDRQIALSRALAAREYLLKENITASRIDVRALGAQTDIAPLDRVEFYLIK